MGRKPIVSQAVRQRREQPKRAVVGLAPLPQYLFEPVHGPKGKFGGTEMFVILGPAACRPSNYGSGTTSSSLAGHMRPLKRKDPGKWIAGHLLNDNMGGSGTAAKNLTPLTETTNKRHAKIETRINRLCTRIDSWHSRRENYEFPDWYGIKYVVTVSATAFGSESPYTRAPEFITVTARAVRIPKSEVQQLADEGVSDDTDINSAMFDDSILTGDHPFAVDPGNIAPTTLRNEFKT